ncbi:MAG: tetratricopeptide repeat protein [Treponema sp.]|nr:tetratricopeptide repeat protein [Treponema sp.]
MKKIRETVIGVIVVAAIIAGVLWVYNNERNKVNRDLAKRISALSPRGGPPNTIEGLREAIALYEAQIERNVQEGAQTGAYWKILAIRLADRGMHRDALDAIERAIYFNSDDPTLFYLTGEYASIVAAATVGFSANAAADKEHFVRLAENSYLRAIQMDAGYARPLLGLGILYTFDQNRPAEAIPLLERYLQLLSSDVRGMFVLARAYFMTSNYEMAIELYDRIIARTKDQKIKAEAQNNIETIRNLMYG